MTEPSPLPHRLDRRVVIAAARDLVFQYFTDSARWARWWGAGSSIEPHVGGAVSIVHPGGVKVAGRVTAIEPPHRIAFTYGYRSGSPIPEDGSHVTIELDERDGSTELRLTHVFAGEATRDQFIQGWRYQLAVFANVVASDAHTNATHTVDAWFAAWSEPSDDARESVLQQVASPTITFLDRFSHVSGMEDLRPHLAAVHKFMPGMRVARAGGLRHCQGHVLADWVATGPDGAERGRGTNLFVLTGDGRVRQVVGFWE